MQEPHTPRSQVPPDRETLELWYALGRLYAEAAPIRNRSARLGFTVTLISGAAVLLSAPLVGTTWVGPFAPAVPVVLGLISGFGMFFRERFILRRSESSIHKALRRRDFDPARPTANGLSAYYDAQLILLRSEYEYLLEKGAYRSARLFERGFGFLADDPFETGPLNISPDTKGMRLLRESWDTRLATMPDEGETPVMGLREDLAYRVFPREMTVPAEMATREAYLTVSITLMRKRYGRKNTLNEVPESKKARAKKDLAEYAGIRRRTSPQPRREPRSRQPPEGRN